MKNILLPTDFSQNSLNAINYAMELFKDTPCKFYLLNAFKIPYLTNEELLENDMKKMAAEVGDLVYLCDARGILGGLKSVHTVYGEPHEEDGVVYINNEHLLNGVFIEGKKLTAEKEM